MTIELKPIVFIVDDDKHLVESLVWTIDSIGLQTKTYLCAEDFLQDYNPDQHGCLILDIVMPGMSGLELQETLNDLGSTMPIIFISGFSDIPVALKTMKAGAYDFFTKPFNDQILLENINKALMLDKQHREKTLSYSETEARYALLSQREIQVLQGVIEGKQNREIAEKLSIALKTVEAHRGNMMKKMNVKSASQLVKLMLANDLNLSRKAKINSLKASIKNEGLY